MRGILIGLALTLVALPALAQTQQQHDWCFGADTTDDQTIEGCNALILSGSVTGKNLAAAYFNRGLSYRHKDLIDSAISDYTQAIAITPSDSDIYNNRGFAYEKKGFRDQAIADYRMAVRLGTDPNDTTALDNLKRLGVTP